MTSEENKGEKNLKVLALEDSARDSDLIKEQLLDAGYRLSMERVETEDAFAASLRDKAWDIILADFKLPGFDAVGALRIRNEICPDTPFICISGSIGEETAIELLKSGAVDYVIKDRPERLPFVVGRALEEARAKGIRQQKEAELKRVTRAVEQTGEAIMITDPDGRIVYVNPAFTAVSGYSREEAVGQNPRILKSGKHDLAFYQELWDTIAAGRDWKGRTVNRHKDGTLYTEEATVSPVKDASGQILNYVAVKRDVTEYLRAEEERANLQEQFNQAQKVESIGLLAGGVAHDFNNILSVILGYGEYALNKLHKGDPLREDIQQIIDAAHRAATLTRQLLAFSRKQTLQPETLDLNQLINDFEKMLHRLIGEDIELELDLAPDISLVKVDPGQIEQVIMNLVVNARDAMPQGGKLIIETAVVELDNTFIAKHPGAKPGKHVLLAVTDTGCGMSQETLSQIFEPFFTTKEIGRGTGLGLSTVYGIIKQSGGGIWGYSEPDRGTTFKVYLPSTDSPLAPAAKREPVDAVVVGAGHILVVEDEEILRKLMAILLARIGYKVTLAANGGEALLLIEEKGLMPDLIITDIVMPLMSGKQLIDRLSQRLPNIKVLFMSGYTDHAIIQDGVLEPGQPFIQKPFTIDCMAATIQKVMNQPR